MAEMDISGSTEINDTGIKKHFARIDSWRTIAELIWNGFDAKAKSVEVEIQNNELQATDRAEICDNGEGIDFANIKDNFGRFNDSAKKGDLSQHGSHGRGRLSFCRACHQAAWHTKNKQGCAEVKIDSRNIKHFSGKGNIPHDSMPPKLQTLDSGTCVTLSNFFENLPGTQELLKILQKEFGWYLSLHSDKHLSVNGTLCTPPANTTQTKKVRILDWDFDITVVRWHDKPESEKSYVYMLNSQGRIRDRQLSSFNQKPNFYSSIFIQSEWADNFEEGEGDLLRTKENTRDADAWKKALKEASEITQRVYDDFIRSHIDGEIKSLEENGIFPTYAGLDQHYAEWRLSHTKKIVRSLYEADPSILQSLNKKQKKIIVRLLDRLAVSNENDALFEIINGVLDLGEKSLERLSSQLRDTTLEHIISTIETLQQRLKTINMLRTLMNVHYKDVLETPDLQKIIENNTWLFGPQFETIGAEEDNFTRIAKDFRNKILGIDSINSDDLDPQDSVPVEGAQRQTDLFLARKMPQRDATGRQVFHCTIIEIKRPSISLNYKHLKQLDEYAQVIKRMPEFGESTSTRFNLILVGRKISSQDSEIASRMHPHLDKGRPGLINDEPRMSRFVMSWYTLLDDLELSHNYLLEKLALKRDRFEATGKTELIQELQGTMAADTA